MPDLDHPLAAYADHFKDLHAHHVSDYFENLVQVSGVDEQQNKRLVMELREVEGAIASSKSARNGWFFGLVVGILVAIGSTIVAFAVQGSAYLLLIVAVIVAFVLWGKVRGELIGLNSLLQGLSGRRDAKGAEAWAQMEPLNRLHSWGVAQLLFQKTFPEVELDRYVDVDRVHDLESNYGLDPNLGDGRSVLFPQSGSFKENPFVAVSYLQHWIGTRHYDGSLAIQWTEQVRNPDGQLMTVHRSQTLTAQVVKPFPLFQEDAAVIYGHDAAPHLSFSRRSSKLSGLNEGRFNDWRKSLQVKKVERLARRAVTSGNGQLTFMANKEFEAQFNATDRNDEIEFRLLFTPLAQQEMVKLLNDRSTGYGDDFSFKKAGLINIVEPVHLGNTRLDGNPRPFPKYELADARRFFTTFHADYFRSLYFSLVPFLTIPLYQERRSTPIRGNRAPAHESCAWEHESIANLFGESTFQHQASVTRSLLKTASMKVNDSVNVVTVTALGYQGFSRVDYVPVRGGDGYVYAVPVHWTEYIGVQASRQMLVGVIGGTAENEQIDVALERNWSSAVLQYGASPTTTSSRGSLAAIVL